MPSKEDLTARDGGKQNVPEKKAEDGTDDAAFAVKSNSVN